MDFFFRDDVSVCRGYDAVGDGCHREVVGNDYECLTESVAQVGDDVAYLIAVSGVEAACRFIGKITSGSLIIALAIAARCLSPPDISAGL